MISIRRPVEFPWLDGCFWDVAHPFGPAVTICRADVPADVVLPLGAVGRAELLRAARMRDREDAHRFLASHATLRSVLAHALGLENSRLELTVDESGKPRLVGRTMHFNMSRCGSALLIGLSEVGEIGVDIERSRELLPVAALARTHLAASEYAVWRAADPRSRDACFVEFWTRKEACVKAAGTGLAVPFVEVEVGLGVQRSSVQVAFRAGQRDWTMQVASLPTPPRLVAAAAVGV